MQTTNSLRFAYLDGWRTIAVCLVICWHLVVCNQQLSAALRNHVAYLNYGVVGVYIFFFISGYVVSSTCFSELRSSGSFSVGGFYVRRVFRIIPPLIVYVLGCLLLSRFGCIRFSVRNFFSSISYLSNSALPFLDCGWYGDHTWSLSFEEQFYLLFPMFFAWLQCGRRPRLPLLLAALSIALIPFLWPIIWIGRGGFAVTYSLFTCGFLAAKYQYIPQFIGPMLSRAVNVLSLIITFLPMEIGVRYFGAFAMNKYYKFVFILSIPALVITSGLPGTLTNRLVSSKLLSSLGRVTYSVYLWQQIIAGPVLGRLPLVYQSLLVVPLFAFCIAIFRLYEIRLIQIGRALSDKLKRNSDTRMLA